MTTSTATENDLYIKLILGSWDIQNGRVNKLLGSLSEEQIQARTAPDRNTGTYIIGHLTAVSDGMFPLLDLGNKLFPHLENIFITHPDHANLERPSFAELKNQWHSVSETLTARMKELKPADWLTRHTAISTEDFAKEPHRNKLNVVINRTNHISYHLGQLAYLVKK